MPRDLKLKFWQPSGSGPLNARRALREPVTLLVICAFKPGFSRWRCWPGPSWMNTAWLLVPAMRSLGYWEDADRVVQSLEHSVDRYGFREYYNPLSGRGLAARGFGFSTLIVDLLADCAVGPDEPSAQPRMMQP